MAALLSAGVAVSGLGSVSGRSGGAQPDVIERSNASVAHQFVGGCRLIRAFVVMRVGGGVSLWQ